MARGFHGFRQSPKLGYGELYRVASRNPNSTWRVDRLVGHENSGASEIDPRQGEKP
jgi:hypothetical protein